MTQEALKLALDWAEAHGEIVFAGGGMSAVNKMNSWVAAIKEALAKEKALQALHSENERLGLYKDAYAQPEQEPVTWGVDWGKAGDISCVSIIKRLPNGGIEVVAVEYAPYSYTNPPQRTWVGLTDDEISALSKGHIVRSTYARAIEANLKERNDHSI